MEDIREREIRQNKAIRGYIIRSLVKGHNNSLLVRQIANALVNEGLIFAPDVTKYLDYLKEAGYIVFTNKKITAYTAYQNDAVIKLTKSGIDLAEGTIDDAGVDI